MRRSLLLLLVAALVTAMFAAGAAAPAMAKDIVLRNQPTSINGELVQCDLLVYDEDDDEIEVCIPHNDNDDDDDHEQATKQEDGLIRRGLWVGAVTFVVAAAMRVGYASILNKTAQAVLLDGELQDGFIQPDVSRSYDGYWAWLAGDIACTEGERVEVNAWMVQPSRGAEAEGTWQDTCTGAPQLWNTSSVPSQNSSSFEEGTAEVCATAWTRSNNGTTDMFQGCSEVEALLLRSRDGAEERSCLGEGRGIEVPAHFMPFGFRKLFLKTVQ